MVCFCTSTASQLALMLPAINAAAEVDLGFAADVQAIADWLTSFGLPAAPWSPPSGWLELTLPSISLSAGAIATISAAAGLRAQVLGGLGIDLLVPAQARAFVRLAATLSARLTTMMDANVSLGLGVWPRLSASLQAITQVDAALRMGIFASPPSTPSFAAWQPFVTQLRLLLPITGLSANLDLDLAADFSAELSAMVQAILGIPMPDIPVVTFTLMATLSASLNAIAQLSASLGVDPLQAGVPAVQAMISARLQAVADLAASLSLNLPSLVASLPALNVTFNPTAFATSATVASVLALNAQALGSLDLQLPAASSLPVLSVGLPIASLSAQLSALGFAAATAPCGGMCDAAGLLNAALSGTAGISAMASI